MIIESISIELQSYNNSDIVQAVYTNLTNLLNFFTK